MSNPLTETFDTYTFARAAEATGKPAAALRGMAEFVFASMLKHCLDAPGAVVWTVCRVGHPDDPGGLMVEVNVPPRRRLRGDEDPAPAPAAPAAPAAAPPIPMPDAQAMAAMARLFQDPQPIGLTLSKAQAWVLGAAVQLACRHPQFAGPSRQIAEGAARQMMDAAGDGDPDLQVIARAGWEAQFDVPRDAPAGDDDAPRPEPFDLQNMEAIIAGKHDHLTARLFRLVKKMDREQRDRLRRVYPHHVAAVEQWDAAPYTPGGPAKEAP